MSKAASPESLTYELNTTSRTHYRNSLIEEDILSNLKGQVFEKGQSRQNYENLLAKYHKLQEDLEKIIQMRNQYEIMLRQQESDEKN